MRWLMMLLVTAPLSGCFWWGDDDDWTDDGFTQGPEMGAVSVPSWPPVGPHHAVSVEAFGRDGGIIERVRFQFANTVQRQIRGVSVTASATGSELGEGFGRLVMEAFDDRGLSSSRVVDDLLVDLSPPVILPGEAILRRAEGVSVEMYVADAWVLGNVRLSIGDVSQEHAFQQGWPATLGTDWDLSLVQFDTLAFPEGQHSAVIVAHDAAGNEARYNFEMHLDGTPPSAGISAPAPGSTVSGPFEVSVHGEDGGLPVWLTIAVGGTPLATAVGPSATVALDASELTPGPTTLEVVAMDRAGNVSETSTIPLFVE